jgi:hypothetical protein
MLRRYWELPDTAMILFELERSRSDGTTRRGGIPPEIWAEILESPVESIFVNVVNEKQEPSRTHQARQKQAQTPTPVSTFSAGPSSSHHAVTSSGDEYCGGAFRPLRKKHRSSTSLSHGRNGWRKAGRRAQGKLLELDRSNILTYYLSKVPSLADSASSLGFPACFKPRLHSSV